MVFTNFPFGDVHDYFPYEVQRPQQHWRRQREMEARRRAELELMHRMKREQEAERQRRQEEIKRKAELAYYQKLKQQREEERKRAELVATHKREHENSRQGRARSLQETHKRRSKFDRYPLVRGRDGRLYRAVPQPDEVVVNRQNVDDQDGKSQELAQRRTKDTQRTIEEDPTMVIKPTEKVAQVKESLPKKSSSRRRRQRVTVIVEDASDSESEDNELSSAWRNRRPSPGQWIEPVEDFE